ncbi:uncharacterized protein LOC141877885 isoform X3 [Acropora palmata]|uniref:uncharacterized protein LOC141877885 isoform X3 n=1 Tax=Acropora palmata TaxID=6131 RepID=UPI003DA07FF1
MVFSKDKAPAKLSAGATMENILVTCAIWKSSSMSQNFQKVLPAKPGFLGFSSGILSRDYVW